MIYSLLKSLGMNRLAFWKSAPYVAWRLHTAYGVPYDQGMMKALLSTARKIGWARMFKDSFNLGRWLSAFKYYR
jgi:hypothetical protein